jgi:CRISPR type III-B/RAMP module-associated protein Cmr5
MTDTVSKRITTPEQRRAKAAWEQTEDLSGSDAEDFASQCKQTSARIHISGLLVALAFLNAKTHGKNAEMPGPAGQTAKCGEALASWLSPFIDKGSTLDLENVLNWLIDSADGTVLPRLQSEALAYLEWHARLAEGRAIEQATREEAHCESTT